jgi:hypothetical protein
MNEGCAATGKSKIKFGARGTTRATVCTDCAKGLRFVLMGGTACEMVDANGSFICISQSNKVNPVDQKNYCTTHANQLEEQTKSTVLKCVEPGCDKNRFIQQYCETHAKDHNPEYKRTRGMCIDCGETRATFKFESATGGAKYCEDCIEQYSDQKFVSTNPKCDTCHKTTPSWKNGPNAPATRCKDCTPSDDPNWISINTGRTIVEQLARDALIKSKGGCQTAGCTVKSPSFGLIWKQPTHCAKHKGGDLINVVSIKCAIKGCDKYRSYGYDWRKPIVCKTHSTGGMENVVSKRCAQCKIIASYGYVQQKPTHCMAHGLKQDDPMHNVVSKQCATNGCKTRPTFGLYGGSPTYCGPHKSDKMIDVVHIKCAKPKCLKRACFGTEVNAPEYCITHKTDEMEDVVHTKCLDETCMVRPSFGFEFGSAEYCFDHKIGDMIDVVSKRCEADGCYSQAAYNHEGLMVKYCYTHKLDGMIYGKAAGHGCKHPSCSTRASFANEGETAEYCFTHKADSMINVNAYRCHIPSCTTQISSDDKYKGYCFNCFYINYPDEPVIRNHKIKEKTIMNSITSILTEYHIDQDQMIAGSGCRRRPDGLLKLSDHNIVIEIDEHQHKYYGLGYESDRNSEIYAALGKQPLTIIRFNPDSYKVNTEKYLGLFVAPANRLLEIKDLGRYDNAIVALVASIQKVIREPPTESKDELGNIHTVWLRFDSP